MYAAHTPVVLRPGSTAEVSAIVKLANETGTAIVPQGGNTGLVRRPDADPRRDRAVAQPPRQDPRGRSDLEHHHLRGRRDPAARARGRRRGRPALSAAAAVGRHLHDRRQSLDQCRRHRGARARRRALARARPRSRAGRRPRAQQPQQAQEGQHRLRPEEPVHRRRRHARRHHRRGAAAGAAAALGRDRVRRRAVARGGARTARHRHRAHRRRRDQLRDHAADGRRAGDRARHRLPQSAVRPASLVRADRAVVAGALRPAREPGGHPCGRLRARADRRRHRRRQPRPGQDVLAHPRDVRRGAAPGRRLDQARRVGAGRGGAGVHRARRARRW